MKSSYVIIAMLAITCYKAYHLFYPNESCDVTPPIRLNLTAAGIRQEFAWDACHVYSLEYTDARDKFRKAARKMGAEAASIPVVMDDGTEDSPLTMDIAILRGNLPGVFIHTSGTHGVEGYAGSAIQVALLQDGVLPPPEKRPTVVLVHAVNPSGMKAYRRGNENNVDLNRNAISNFEDFLKGRPDNIAGYEDFRYMLSPERAPSRWWDATVGFWLQALPAIYRNDYVSLKRVLVAGQYHHPKGVFYGGKKMERSLEGLMNFVTSEERGLLAPLGGDVGRVVWVDVHTGLGPLGMDTLASEKAMSPEEMSKWFPTAYRRLTPDSKNVGALDGYELVNGMLPTLVYETTKKTALAMTQEFGTLPGVLVARSLILENMIHQFGDDEGRRTLGRPWLQAAFYPQSSSWRSSIVQRGVALALQSIDYIAAEDA